MAACFTLEMKNTAAIKGQLTSPAISIHAQLESQYTLLSFHLCIDMVIVVVISLMWEWKYNYISWVQSITSRILPPRVPLV
ncbi:hypothetical protein ZWY2020_033414 [Hordeum vulgare]|nr:hypothetical protein ZWY2020_033414 [Hordeum vulgare]